MKDNSKVYEFYDSNKRLFRGSTTIKEKIIILQLESGNEKYLAKLSFKELQHLNRYFKQSDNLEKALKDLNYLLGKKYSIETAQDCIHLIIKYREDDINFVLRKDNNDISYNNLSDKMKNIIKNHQLVLGIDLGTTNSCAAVMIEDKIIMIRNALGSTTTASFLYFLNEKEVYVGDLAKLLPSNEKNIIYNIKRLLGQKIDDDEIKKIKKKLPFQLKRDERFNLLKIVLNFNGIEEEFYPEQLCALILKKIVEDSEFYLSKKIGRDIKIKKCVITVPAYFNQKQRESTFNSAKIIGLEVKTMINEPTSATIAYAYKYFKNVDKKLIVIDFGGGTLDITLLKYRKDNSGNYCDVKFAYGDPNFGGEDFDNVLMSEFIKNFNQNSSQGANFIYDDENKNNPKILRLKRACERAKINLSIPNSESTEIHIGSFSYSIKKSEFEKYCKELFKRFENKLTEFINKSQINKDDNFEIILIGKTTLMPEIRKRIIQKFKNAKINCDLDPKESVAKGAAIRGAKFMDLSSVSDINLFDVTNLPLGIKKIGNIFHKILERSTKTNEPHKDTFVTVEDNQTKALIEVYEGEEEQNCSEKNLFLGNFEISGFPKKKAGKVEIEVKMEINHFSILKVTAWEKLNESNRNNIVIKKLIDFSKIMNQLQERENKFYFIKNDNYDDIKYSIILSEEIIRVEENKEKVNIKNIKDQYLNIFIKIADFIIQNNVYINIYISIIKYYFMKMCDFCQKYKIDNEFSNKIKDNIPIFFEKMQSGNMSNLIIEIIEEIVNQDNIKKDFIEVIMANLWSEIFTIFELTNIDKNEKYDVELNNLSRIKSWIKVCEEIIENFDKEKKKIGNITKSSLENMKLKIAIREIIIKHKNSNDLNVSSDIRDLEQKFLTHPYLFSLEEKDLEELEKISKSIRLIYDDKFGKGIKFINWIKNDIGKNIFSSIKEILDNYPYDKNEENKQEKLNKYYEFKNNEISKSNYLDLIKGKYQHLLDVNNGLTDSESEIYNEILVYLNKISESNNYKNIN